MIDTLIKNAGDPDLAERQWRVIQPLLGPLSDHPQTPPVLRLLGNSRFLVEHLIKEPDSLPALIRNRFLARPKDTPRMREEIEALWKKEKTQNKIAALKVLRHYKYAEMARIAVRDLAGLASFEEIGMELAGLAAAASDFALQAARRFLKLRGSGGKTLVVIGLGKMGGGDLNFSSDIDLLYVYGDPKDYEDCVRLSEETTRLLNDRTPDGLGFRVDLNLRPQGKSGPLVNSLEAIETYYEVFGASWERGALVKALPVAGDLRTGEDFLKTVEPFVYRKTIDSGVILEIKKMKERIDEELAKTAPKGFHVKLGRGGIREIEFFVTAFQLVYGGKEHRLRERNTLRALDVLRDLELIPANDALRLKEAYISLRKIENRLQMVDERQIHTLPPKGPELQALARRMGLEGEGKFLEELNAKTDFVFSCFERLAP